MPRTERTAKATRRAFLSAAAAAPAALTAATALDQAPTPGTPQSPPLTDTSSKVAKHRVYASIERTPKELVARFRALIREVVTEHLGKSQLMDPAIRPLANRVWDIVGPAVTVNIESFDHLM